MASHKREQGSDPLKNLTNEQLAELVEWNDALDQEEARIIKEDREDEKRSEKARL